MTTSSSAWGTGRETDASSSRYVAHQPTPNEALFRGADLEAGGGSSGSQRPGMSLNDFSRDTVTTPTFASEFPDEERSFATPSALGEPRGPSAASSALAADDASHPDDDETTSFSMPPITPQNGTDGFEEDDPAKLPPPPPPPGSPPPASGDGLGADGHSELDDDPNASPQTKSARESKRSHDSGAARAQYVAAQEALALQRAKEAEAASSARAARRERRAPPPVEGGEGAIGELSFPPYERRSSRARALEFEGPSVEADMARILTVDSRGHPIAAAPIVKYALDNNLTMEGLLNTVAQVGQHNTAVRAWIKGEKLGRPSVRMGAAYILEWYDALVENRPRRNMIIKETEETAAKPTPKKVQRGRPKNPVPDPLSDAGAQPGRNDVEGEDAQTSAPQQTEGHDNSAEEEPNAKRLKPTILEEEPRVEEQAGGPTQGNEAPAPGAVQALEPTA